MNDLDGMGVTQQGANMRACLQKVQPKHAFMIGKENRTGAPAKNMVNLNTTGKKQKRVKRKILDSKEILTAVIPDKIRNIAANIATQLRP